MSCYKELSSVQKPYQYVGHEENTYNKDFNKAALRFCIAFPDAYEIGMANVGMQIIYHTLNEQADIMADRVYAPLIDMGDALKKNNELLLARESSKPLNAFDCVGFTLQYELCYTNLLYMLDLGGIPRYAKDRSETDPLVCAGGPCVYNPEPVADFLDFVVIGEGEEVILEVVECLAKARAELKTRREKLLLLAKIPGIYIPSFYQPSYDSTGKFLKLERGAHAPRWVERRIIADLDKVPYPTKPVTPAIRPVHDRVSVEVQRGCTRGCRFCQAGYIYRPRRERDPRKVVEIIEESIKNTGIYDIGLLSLSSADYSHIHPVMKAVMERYKKEHLSVALPSTRLEALKEEYLDVLKEERRSGFTIAPEAGSQRLRDVINKNFTEEEVIETVKMLFANGWQSVKMYFMIGLPTETDDDVKAIAELGNTAFRAVGAMPGRKNITISVSNFVPKPHTPFQWHAQISHTEIRRKQDLVRGAIAYPKNITFRTHNADLTFAEGIVARGSRQMAKVIERAYELGAKFDCWQDLFNLKIWQEALSQILAETGIDHANEGLRAWSFDERLPWHRIYCGIHPKFFKNEFNKAIYGLATEDCSFSSCTECGLCNEKTGVYPVIKTELITIPSSTVSREHMPAIGPKREYRFQYQKVDAGIFISPVDLQNLLLRAFKRSDILVVYDSGMRPRPKLSMGPALPVGVASRSELFDIWLETAIAPAEIIERLNQYLPEHLRILTGTALADKALPIHSLIRGQSFAIALKTLGEKGIERGKVVDLIAQIKSCENFPIARARKNRYGEMQSSNVDLKAHLRSIQITDDSEHLEFTLNAANGQSVSPYLLIEALTQDKDAARQFCIHKTGFTTA